MLLCCSLLHFGLFFLLFLFLLCAHSRNWWSNCFTARFFFRAVGSSKAPGGTNSNPKVFWRWRFCFYSCQNLGGAIVPSVPPVPTAQMFFFFSIFSFCRLHFQTMWHWHGFISVHYPPTFIVQQNTLARISYYCLKII